jgi:hypothetical protein
MNKESFYKGILAELEKQAYIPYPQPKDKKKSVWTNPLLWAGLGTAGLGAYSLYKGKQGNPTPPPQTTLPTESDSSTLPSFSSQLGGLSYTKDTPFNLKNFAKDVSTNPNVMSGYAGLVGKAIKQPWLDRAGTTGMMGIGAPMLYDAIANPDQQNIGNRLLEGGAGVGDLGLQALGKRRLAEALTKAAPDSLSNFTANRLASTAAKRLVSGAAFAPAFAADMAAEGAMGIGVDQANRHADMLSDLSDTLTTKMQELKQNPKSDQYLNALNEVHSIFDNVPGQHYINEVTNPQVFARLGLGQYYHLPTWLGGKGYSQSPGLDPINNLVSKAKGLYNTELDKVREFKDSSGNTVNSSFRIPAMVGDLNSMKLTEPGSNAFANSVPALDTPVTLPDKITKFDYLNAMTNPQQ